MNANENTPVYNWEDAIKFIHERCKLSKDAIIKVLELEEEYMKSVGIIVEEEMEESNESKQIWNRLDGIS